MNHYETVFILNPVLSEAQIEEAVQKYEKFLISKGGSITSKENWGLKKLKYVIQKKKTGFYYLLEFQAEGSIINNFEVEFQRDERVIRWQTVRLDKYAMEYADRRRKKLNEKSKSE